jgi:hypothetical protein
VWRASEGFELEPEVRDWLDSLSDSDYKRVDEVCGLLAEKGTELGGPWSDHLEGRSGSCGSAVRQLPEDNMTRNRSRCLVCTPHYAEPGTSEAAGRQVIQIPALTTPVALLPAAAWC